MTERPRHIYRKKEKDIGHRCLSLLPCVCVCVSLWNSVCALTGVAWAGFDHVHYDNGPDLAGSAAVPMLLQQSPTVSSPLPLHSLKENKNKTMNATNINNNSSKQQLRGPSIFWSIPLPLALSLGPSTIILKKIS